MMHRNQNEIDSSFTGQVIGVAMKVHNILGPGLLESAYQETLYYYLRKDSR